MLRSLRKIVVVGSGAREHALALRLLESPTVGEVVVTPGNAGTLAAPPWLAEKQLSSRSGEPLEVAREEQPDLVVVGPEAPLAAGLVDELADAGLPAFGPSREAAQIEASKAFMKDFARRYGIPTADYVVLREASEIDAALRRFPEPPVVKADGLCAGKGVVVAASHDEARRVALAMLSGESFGDAGKIVVLEERVSGAEASIHAISDGERYVVLPVAQDHKRIGDGDRGPNTGGMGTYAPAPLVDAALAREIERRFIAPAIGGLAEDGRAFRGTLFANVMVRPNGEPVLLEFNARFGDPETQVLLGVVDGDLADALAQAAEGALAPSALTISDRHAVCVVLAAAGYPDAPHKGDAIDGLEAAAELPGVRIYHAGTRLEGDRIVTAGGRVLGITADGASLQEAHARAYAAVDRVRFSGMQFRRDIAARALYPD